MCNSCLTIYERDNGDPTRTVTLRKVFTKQMNKRFNALIASINKAVYVDDCFGLRPVTNAASPGVRAFDFPTSQMKIEAFNEWLEAQINSGILETTNIPVFGTEKKWTDQYIRRGYEKGIDRARAELRKINSTIPTLAASGGIEAVLQYPVHIDKLSAVYARTFNDLKGITSNMDSQISRILAEGLTNGDNPKFLAEKMVSTIKDDLSLTDELGRFVPARRRAETLARTEIIRAHHSAMVEEYRNWGLEGVKVKAEWQTAGDRRVCPECQTLEGNIYTLDQIQTMIPRHPNCRCIALPLDVTN